MKFIFDHNLSPKLVRHFAGAFPGSVHTTDLNFDREKDHLVWEHAARNNFGILTKDTDFEQLSLVRGAPPKVVWLRIGNASNNEVIALIESHLGNIEEFMRDEERSLLALGR